MRLSLSRILTLTGATGDISGRESVLATGAATDSRAVKPGDLFVCLKGERADGHDFAAKAAASGAAAVLAERELPGLSCPVLLVPDALAALGRLARGWRDTFAATVVAVTGSAGKTTVKELAASALSTTRSVHKSRGNYNNQLGLPLSLLAATGREDVVVVELGISRPGDMDELAAIAAPDLAVVHNIGPAHLEGLGDLAGVGREKAAVFGHLAANGLGVANRDYPELWSAAVRLLPGVRSLSTRDESADFFCAYLGSACEGPGAGLGRYRFRTGGREQVLEAPVAGAHFAENVGAAAAIAVLLGLDPAGLGRGLCAADGVKGRFSLRTSGGLTLIDDTYNANPLSMACSIRAAAELAGERPLALVLGDMLELGACGETAHRELGRAAAASGAKLVAYKGAFAEPVRQGLGNGRWEGTFLAVDSADAFAKAWAGTGFTTGVVLVKGSRSCRMEELAEAIVAPDAGAED